MFEDIINYEDEEFIDLDDYKTVGPYCYVCGSQEITSVGDKLSSKSFTQDCKCNVCGAKWRETYDTNLNIDKVEVLK